MLFLVLWAAPAIQAQSTNLVPASTESVAANDNTRLGVSSQIEASAHGELVANASVAAVSDGNGLRLAGPSGEPQTASTIAVVKAKEADAIAAVAGVVLVIGVATALHPGLVGPAIVAMFSRIERHALLSHPVRLRIHAAILEQPGITIKEVAKSQGIGWGTTVYHLGRLEQGRLVTSQRHRQFRRFYDAKSGPRGLERSVRAELIHPTSQVIVERILADPGASQRGIADAVGISAPAAHKYLARLEEAQLIVRRRDAKRVRYFPTQELLDRRSSKADGASLRP